MMREIPFYFSPHPAFFFLLLCVSLPVSHFLFFFATHYPQYELDYDFLPPEDITQLFVRRRTWSLCILGHVVAFNEHHQETCVVICVLPGAPFAASNRRFAFL